MAAKHQLDPGSGFITNAGVTVSFVTGDITTFPSDCVICPVDEKISCTSGSSKDIKRASNENITQECKEKKTMALKEVHPIKGEPRWKFILLARFTGWNEVQPQAESVNHLTEVVHKCFKTADNSQMTSIALPLVGSGDCKIPEQQCLEAYKAALEKYDTEVSMSKSLKNISFVDLKQQMIEKAHEFLSKSMKASDTVRLVLVGKTGVGKSKIGNTILSNATFSVSDRWKSETMKSSMGKTVYRGYLIEVVDTPGLFDEEEAHEEKILKEILKSIIFSLPGPHVFCLLFRADTRFTRTEVEVYKKLEELFHVELKQFLMVVLTHSPPDGKNSLNYVLDDPPDSFSKLLVDVQQRVVGIDSDGPAAGTQVQSVLDMAIKIKNSNSAKGTQFYTNRLVSRCLQLLQSDRFANKTLEEIKKEVQQQDVKSEPLKTVISDPVVDTTVKQSNRRWCVIL